MSAVWAAGYSHPGIWRRMTLHPCALGDVQTPLPPHSSSAVQGIPLYCPPCHTSAFLSVLIFTVGISLLVSILSRAHHGHPLGGCWQAGGYVLSAALGPRGSLQSLLSPLLYPLPSRCGRVPCSWQTTSCSGGTSSRDALC